LRSRLLSCALSTLPVACLLTASVPAREVGAQVTVASTNAGPVAPADRGAVAPPTFYGDVLPILQESCQQCHRPGEVAPMSLLTYEDARSAARKIGRMVGTRRMPPWTADNSVGLEFHNNRALTEEQIATILAWVDEGAPEGEGRAMSPPRHYVEGWQIDPDMIVELPTFEIPATGTVEYTYYIVPEPFTEDRWIKLSELRPSNTEVTHHLLAYVRPPGSSYFRDYPAGEYFVPLPGARRRGPEESANQWRQQIGGYAPGSNPGEANFPDDQAVLVKAGSEIVFEVHYNTKGEPMSDTPRLGLDFLEGEPATRRLSGMVINAGFTIPPGASDHRVDAAIRVKHDATLLSLTPHMHLRGKSFEYRAVFPDGRTEVLLSVPAYDFNWQITHYLSEPLLLPAGTVIEGTAYFDNSDGNRHNPDPTSPVEWGDQSWEEMMIGFFTVALDPAVDAEEVFGRR
jgi:mono/diheme cytochrome c family protein